MGEIGFAVRLNENGETLAEFSDDYVLIRGDYGFSYGDYKSSLVESGLKKNDLALVFFDTKSFIGELNSDVKKEDYCDFFLKGIFDIIGKNGAMLVPTFTYSFCSGKVFDPVKSKPTNGIIPTRFLKLKGITRYLHGIYSYSHIGEGIDESFYESDQSTCFGSNSLNRKILYSDMKTLFVGHMGPRMYTPAHCLEEEVTVPHRYMKFFSGEIHCNGEVEKQEVEFYVRNLEIDAPPIFENFEYDLVKNHKIAKVKLGSSWVWLANNADLLENGQAGINRDKDYFVKWD